MWQKCTLIHLACIPSPVLEAWLDKTHTAQRLTNICLGTSMVLSSQQCARETSGKAEK